MANEYKIRIDDYEVKEMRCKNDTCRALLGYENVKIGVMIFTCPSCGFISIFHMKYREAGKKFIDTLKQKFEVKEGGEKVNG